MRLFYKHKYSSLNYWHKNRCTIQNDIKHVKKTIYKSQLIIFSWSNFYLFIQKKIGEKNYLKILKLNFKKIITLMLHILGMSNVLRTS